MAFLIHRKEKLFLLRVEHLLGLIAVKHGFGLVHPIDVLRIFQQRHEPIRPRLPELCLVKQQPDFFFQNFGFNRVGTIAGL